MNSRSFHQVESNRRVVKQFFDALATSNLQALKACYSLYASYSDPLFSMQGREGIVTMWRRFLDTVNDFEYQYVTSSTENHCNVVWLCMYRVADTGRELHHRIETRLFIEGGKIVCHEDNFSFGVWLAEAAEEMLLKEYILSPV